MAARLILVALMIVAGVIASAWGFQRRLIYLPAPDDVPPVAEVLPSGGEEVDVHTGDGLTLGAWWVPARGDNLDVTVLVANGNAGHRGLRAPLADALAARGLSVLLFDYRGYGGNPGRPSESGLEADIRAAYRHLREDHGVDRTQIVLFGESLGAGVVTGLAAEDPPGGLVLRSPFTSLADVGRHHYPFLPVRTLLKDRYPVLEQISGVEVPTVVVYGGADRIVPPEQSREVAAASPHLRQLIEVSGAGHNDRALLDGADLVDGVLGLARLVAERAEPR